MPRFFITCPPPDTSLHVVQVGLQVRPGGFQPNCWHVCVLGYKPPTLQLSHPLPCQPLLQSLLTEEPATSNLVKRALQRREFPVPFVPDAQQYTKSLCPR